MGFKLSKLFLFNNYIVYLFLSYFKFVKSLKRSKMGRNLFDKEFFTNWKMLFTVLSLFSFFLPSSFLPSLFLCSLFHPLIILLFLAISICIFSISAWANFTFWPIFSSGHITNNAERKRPWMKFCSKVFSSFSNLFRFLTFLHFLKLKYF